MTRLDRALALFGLGAIVLGVIAVIVTELITLENHHHTGQHIAGNIGLACRHCTMGFGSYDESEQQHQTQDTDDDEEVAVTVHEHEYEGSVSVETGGSTDDLLGQLQDIKENNADEE